MSETFIGLAHAISTVASRLKGQPFYGQAELVKGERNELAARTAELLKKKP